MTDFRNRLKYSATLYHVWFALACLSAVAAAQAALVAEWTWSRGWCVGALALAAHARIERLDGHTHRGGVEAP